MPSTAVTIATRPKASGGNSRARITSEPTCSTALADLGSESQRGSAGPTCAEVVHYPGLADDPTRRFAGAGREGRLAGDSRWPSSITPRGTTNTGNRK